MRTSLNDIKHTEDFLQDNIAKGESLLMKARMILEPNLKADVQAQIISYAVVEEYGRKKLRQKIRNAEREVFTAVAHQSFQHKIRAIFSKT